MRKKSISIERKFMSKLKKNSMIKRMVCTKKRKKATGGQLLLKDGKKLK